MTNLSLLRQITDWAEQTALKVRSVITRQTKNLMVAYYNKVLAEDKFLLLTERGFLACES